MKNNTIIKNGQVVLYYNKWTGWDNREVAKFFRIPSEEEIANLKAGDRVWIDTDPIHLNGKVYGYFLHEITEVNDGKYHYGKSFTSYTRDFRFVDDEEGLVKFLDGNPLASDIIGNSGRMATAIMNNRDNSLKPHLN